ncbi:MAG: hypothetical protein QOJ44_2050 [Acidimicrobiaceae bacterium]|nr:hypothetical protein [Acidimicrobiaceae bacterium]
MPRFEPFPGLRYDIGRVDPNAVIAPPYDVIEPPQRAALARRHSTNAVRVELPEQDTRSGLDRYQNAAHLLTEWQEEGKLLRDPIPSFYAYRMTPPGGGAHTTGIIGALAMDADGSGDVLPHEETLPKPKSDRLDLLRATNANLSPIWGLSLTPGMSKTYGIDSPPAVTATDDEGICHELWVIDDEPTISAIKAAVADSPVVIADGHHRYETSLTFQREQRKALGTDVGSDADLVMALVVELSDEELAVGPVHRILSGLPDGFDLVDAFSSWFDVMRAGEFTPRTTSAIGESGALALVMESGVWLLSPKDGTAEAAGSDLDSSMVALVIAELPENEIEFRYSWRDAVAVVDSEEAQAAVLLRPVTVEQIAAWAHAGRRMPPKSTFFHPKPRTGMVYRTIATPE